MKILYLSYYSAPNVFEKIAKTDSSYSVAAHKFEHQLVLGLLNSKQSMSFDIDILSCISQNINNEENIINDNIRLPIKYMTVKRRSIISFCKNIINARTIILDWLNNNKSEKKIILSYAINPIFMIALQTIPKNYKIITICSEVPKYRVKKGNKLISFIAHYLMEYYNDKMDGYIFFSKYMNEVCNPKNKPWIVVEGLPDIKNKSNTLNNKERQEVIFFAGYLVEKNGIELLLKAFTNFLKDKKVQLIICGNGTLSHLVEEYCKIDNRIKYLGYQDNKTVMNLEKEATLLINPRCEDNILTRYSFPSKTFEYFTSGTATCISFLPGIPDEYYKYCYICHCETAESLAKDLEKILQIPQIERASKAKEAFEFIVREKSSEIQIKRIIEFLFSFLE